MVLIHVGAEIQWVMPPVDVVTWCDDPTSTGKEIWVCIISIFKNISDCFEIRKQMELPPEYAGTRTDQLRVIPAPRDDDYLITSFR